jgi:hypothetical protein
MRAGSSAPAAIEKAEKSTWRAAFVKAADRVGMPWQMKKG